MDRISDLPIPVLHFILSHLSRKELFLTSLLSKHWSSVQASFPIFHFDHTDFLGGGRDIYECLQADPPQKLCDSLENLAKFVDDSLLRFSEAKPQHMQKFKLIIGTIDSKFEWASCLVDKWIEFAVEHQVKEFNLRVKTTENEIYIMPDDFFLAKSVTTVSLRSCELEIPSPSFTFTLLSLKVLYLEQVSIGADMMEKLISDSPVLEEFHVCDCWGFDGCHVPKHRRLKFFKIYQPPVELERVEIAAPNLYSCELDGFGLCEPFMIYMAECQHLKVLKLSHMDMISEQDFHDLISQFPWLEELSVEACMLLKRIKISSGRLRELEVRGCESLTINAPNLRSFSYTCTEIRAYHSIVVPCPWKVYLYDPYDPYNQDESVDIDNLWYHNLKKFLGAASKIECLFFYLSPFQVSFDLEEFKQNSPSPPIQVQELKMEGTKQMQDSNFIDGLLTIFRPKTISLYTSQRDPTTINFNVWLYEYLMKREANTNNNQCWRPFLEDVKLGRFCSWRIEETQSHEVVMDALHNFTDPEHIFLKLEWSSNEENIY